MSHYIIQLRSFQYAPKGSYREEHVLLFLSMWLPVWTEERAAAKDWRLLYLDAFSAHLTQRIRDLAFERGFIVLYHGGGTTGVCQVNDTDAHAAFERDYVDADCTEDDLVCLEYVLEGTAGCLPRKWQHSGGKQMDAFYEGREEDGRRGRPLSHFVEHPQARL